MKKLCCLYLIFALLLVPLVVYAVDETHVHNFVPADVYDIEWDITSLMHAKYHTRLKTCMCGASYFERIATILKAERHVTEMTSQRHNPNQTHTYSYMCTICPYTYSETIVCSGPPCTNHVASIENPVVPLMME